MSKYKALLFDMDGVIVDSNPLHVEAWRVYNQRFGLPMDDAMQKRMFGKRNDELVAEFFGAGLTSEQISAHGAAKEALYRSMMAAQLEQSLVPGLRDFLQAQTNSALGVGTNAEPANVDFVLDNANLRRFFSAIVDGHQVANAKPHPEVYLKLAELLRTPPAECIVFEDSRAGVEAGLAAGMCVVGISTTHEYIPGVALMAADFRDLALLDFMGSHQ